MARIASVVVPDLPHHVTQRGNRREPLFFEADDYRLLVSRVLRPRAGRSSLARAIAELKAEARAAGLSRCGH